jgi:epoxyqueuosine reductase
MDSGVKAKGRTLTKGKIKEFVLSLGMDDVGAASIRDYKSSRSPDLQGIFPGAKPLWVLAYEEL